MTEIQDQQEIALSGSYGLLRAMVRLILAVSFRKIRLVPYDCMPESGPAVLAVSTPNSLLDILIAVAAFERRFYSLTHPGLLKGPMRKFLAKGLDIRSYVPEREGFKTALENCGTLLSDYDAISVFCAQEECATTTGGQLALPVATVALDAEARHGAGLDLKVFPVSIFFPFSRSLSGELLVYIGDPLYPRDYLASDGSASQSARHAFAAVIEKAWTESPFRLQQEDVTHFLSDVRELARVDLDEILFSRSGGKQSSQGFELSTHVKEKTERLNLINPGRFTSLRYSFDRCRENQRRWSLLKIEMERSGEWTKMRSRQVLVWVETILGLPVAVYGLVNHALVGLLWALLDLSLKREKRNASVGWIYRSVVVVACYAGQIFLCAHWFGRSTAGLYAPSLPISGVYLWRYWWLLRKRTRLAFCAFRDNAQAAKLRKIRRQLLDQLSKALNTSGSAIL